MFVLILWFIVNAFLETFDSNLKIKNSLFISVFYTYFRLRKA